MMAVEANINNMMMKEEEEEEYYEEYSESFVEEEVEEEEDVLLVGGDESLRSLPSIQAVQAVQAVAEERGNNDVVYADTDANAGTSIPDAPSLRLDDEDNFYDRLLVASREAPTTRDSKRGKKLHPRSNRSSSSYTYNNQPGRRGQEGDNEDQKEQQKNEPQYQKQKKRFFQSVPKVHRPPTTTTTTTMNNNERVHHDNGGGAGGDSNSNSTNRKKEKAKKMKIPTHIRKIEIELAQRKLPRHPSQTWRTEPAVFYPMAAGGRKITSTDISSSSLSSSKELQIEAFVRARLVARTWFQKHKDDAKRHDDRARQKQLRHLTVKKKTKKEKHNNNNNPTSSRSHRRCNKSHRKIQLKSEQPPHHGNHSSSGEASSAMSMSMSSSSTSMDSKLSAVAGTTGHCDYDDNSSMDDIEILLTDDEDDIDEDDFLFLEDVVDEVVETFYGDEHAKLREVHSSNLTRLEEEEQERKRRSRYLTKTTTDDDRDFIKDESDRMKLAFWLSVKEAQETSSGRNIGEDPDSQFVFLQHFSNHRRIQILHHEKQLKEQRLKKQQLLQQQQEEDERRRKEKELLDLQRCLASVEPVEMKPEDDIVYDEDEGTFEHEVQELDENIEEEEEEEDMEPPQSSHEKEDHYEPKVGVIPPSLKAMILQAQAELKQVKPPPPEHQAKYKPLCVEASEIGQFTRLKEHYIEAMGQAVSKNVNAELPSASWHVGKEKIKGVEKARSMQATRSDQHIMLAMAAALGQIKGLKQKVTTNYDTTSAVDDRVAMFEGNKGNRTTLDADQIDDENEIKKIRLRHLTDYNISEHRKHKSDEIWDADVLEQRANVHYERLEDVPLPTEELPSLPPERLKKLNMSNLELREAMAHEVAEKSWERRYRLERPRAEQRITKGCNCKYCGTETGPNPYQTLAYRKKWIESVHGVAEDEEDEEGEEVKEVPLTHTTEHSLDDGVSFADDSLFLDSMHGELSLGSVDMGVSEENDHLTKKENYNHHLDSEGSNSKVISDKIEFCVEISNENPQVKDDTLGTTESTLPGKGTEFDREPSPVIASSKNRKTPTRTSSLQTPARKKSSRGIFDLLSRSTHGVKSMLGFSQHGRGGSSSRHSHSKTKSPTTRTKTTTTRGATSKNNSEMNISRRQRQRQMRLEKRQQQQQQQQEQKKKDHLSIWHSPLGSSDSNDPLTSASAHSFAEI